MKNKIRYNREFKTIDTEEKAYVLGYFYGDGWITQQRSKKRKISVQYRSAILSKDSDIIDKIENKFPFFNRYLHKYKYHCIYVYSKDMYNDLLLNGVYEKKSSENRHLLKMPELNENLIPHFIRGLYDSDGGFYLYDTLLETFFCSTSIKLITDVQSWLSNYNIITNIRRVVRKNCITIYYLRSKSNKAAKNFFDLIYKDANIFMDRKREVFNNAVMIDAGKKRFLHNLKCNSHHRDEKGQLERLHRDYATVIKNVKSLSQIKEPSICCGYHTIKSGKSYRKNGNVPLYLCLKCGRKSIYNRVLLKQDEMTGTPLEPYTLPTSVMNVV